MSIKVKAKIMGYYGSQRRRPGDVFEIENESERGSWMIGVEDELPPPKESMPFTSSIKGTKAGGNIVGESKADPEPPAEKPKKKKSSKRRK